MGRAVAYENEEAVQLKGTDMPAKKKTTTTIADTDTSSESVVDVNVSPPVDEKPAKKKPSKKAVPKAFAKRPVRAIDEVSFRDPIETSSKKIMVLFPDLVALSKRIIELGFRADEDEVLGNVSSMLRDIYMDEKKRQNQNAKAKR
jgi:hypothetical protein